VGCATTYVSPARFVSRSPAGGVVATPRAEVGMDDANAMIAAHCGAGGYAITREGEAMVGDTVVTEAANSVDAQTTEGSGQVQAHDSSKTVFARGSDWQVHYSCNDPRTVNMGLVSRSRTEPSRFAWGADVAAGMTLVQGYAMDSDPSYSATRSGSATSLGVTAWLGYRMSDKFSMGGGLGTAHVLAMPEWESTFNNGTQQYDLVEANNDASTVEFFATAKYAVAPRTDMQLRIGFADWRNVHVNGAAPLAALQLGYKIVDVGPEAGVYIGAAVSSYFSSSLTNNVSPALTIGFH
jgi:opacity protein-like surface antigen